ncbi:MAG TPA: hypothetical protein VNB22_11765 [Pyrinomonadaceae bacterium]|jgi:hypothetical protein|nr:hypothetical protein [Pyrinomonadaceae bacterium]
MNKILLVCGIVFGGCLSGFSQTDLPPTVLEKNPPVAGSGKRNETQKNNDLVESHSECVAITDFKYIETELIVKLKNICDRRILSAIVRQVNGRYILYNFRLNAEEEYENKININGNGVERGFILESVIFEDGSGSGDAKAVEQIKLFYSSWRNEIEKIYGFIDAAVENPGNDPKRLLEEFKKNIETLPFEMADFRKIRVGGIVPSERGLALQRIYDMETSKNEKTIEFITKGLKNFKKELGYILRDIPTFTN